MCLILNLLHPLRADSQIMLLLSALFEHLLDHFLVLAEVAHQVLHPPTLVLLVLPEQLLFID